MARTKLTKRLVEALRPGSSVFDTELSGFMVRARGSSKTYGVKYFVAGRQRLLTIGRHGPLTVEQARTEAKSVLARVARGEDPQADRSADRLRGRRTVADLAALYLEEHARPKKKARSVLEDERLLTRDLLPVIGKLDIEAVSKADLLALRTRLRDRPVLFNRALALVSKMFALAEQWGLRKAANPARFVEKYPERKRDRFLSAAEYARLFEALNDCEATEHPSVIACVRLLALTGARLSEILTLRWDWVDFEHAALRLPDSKTGAKVVSLPAPALKVLADLPRLSAFVLPGDSTEKHFVGIQRPWRRIRARATLRDLRLHDLRHGFASIAVASGESLKLVGAALGHRQTSTTDRYAHLSTDPLRALADRTAARILSAIQRPMAAKQE
jgi:integrase